MSAARRIEKVLVANRGEIAVRVMRTCREMGLATVAVYSDADRGSLHVRCADEAVHIGPSPARESYLAAEKIVAAARRTGADAIHPGYGFLSEKAEFARLVEGAGLVFVGPPAAAMDAMGVKTTAREHMAAAGVPVVPGSPPLASEEEARAFAATVGYPVMIKAAAGGGGKGMKRCDRAPDLAALWQSAKRESTAAFGDDRLYVEKLLERARHVEIQIFADEHGNVVHLGERECSVQRRQQKIVEESPSTALDDELRRRMCEVAVRAARAVGYRGAGTVEMLLDASRSFYFLEMNTRLQVEHPVTELRYGLDLVRLQLEVAQGGWVPPQETLSPRGHAIECRVYAEDPARGFLPSPGQITYLRSPSGPGVREDSGVYSGWSVSTFYDPLLSKLAVWAPTRDQAIERARRALGEYAIHGISVNLSYLRAVLDHAAFRSGDYDTTFCAAFAGDLLAAAAREKTTCSKSDALWTTRRRGSEALADEKKQRWLEGTYGKATAKTKERKPRFETTGGVKIDPIYTAGDVAPSLEDRLGLPGEYPFTRGVQSTMYRGRFWTMRQYAGFGTAAESNERYRYLLKSGQTGLSVAFDLPTQMGRDSDHPRARGEVGKVGVAIGSIEDMSILLDSIPLGKVSTSMTINATAGILLALYQAVGEKQGVRPEQLQGTIQNDILKEYAARGTYIYPPEQSLRLITDIFAYTAKVMPKWNPISISGYHIREAGSTAVQEVAFTLADGIAYVDAALRAGLDIDAFAGRLSFFFNAHNNLLEEVSKFRAARRLWARIMKERFKAKDPRSMMLRFHTQTAGSMLTAQQPDNNVVRVTIQALAAVLGGTQSLHTNSRDEALGLPTEAAVMIALRTQQIIATESGVADIIDPLGGSWAIEAMTDEIEARANEYLRKIDDMGGMVQAISKGYVQREIQDAAYAWQRQVEAKEQVVVGVNAFRADDPPVTVMKVDPALEASQVASLKAFRAKRSSDAARQAVAAVREAAKGKENLMPLLVAAVKADATLGEISDALRDVFGEYKETVVL